MAMAAAVDSPSSGYLLDDDCWSVVLRHLRVRDALRVAQVCRRLRCLVVDAPDLWEFYCLRDRVGEGPGVGCSDWLTSYRREVRANVAAYDRGGGGNASGGGGRVR